MVVFGDAPPAGSYQVRRKHKFLACDKFLLKKYIIIRCVSHYNKILKGGFGPAAGGNFLF